jgi:hypothetical protein
MCTFLCFVYRFHGDANDLKSCCEKAGRDMNFLLKKRVESEAIKNMGKPREIEGGFENMEICI